MVFLIMIAKVIDENTKIKKSLNALIENQRFVREDNAEKKKKSSQPTNFLKQATYEAYKRHNQDYPLGGDD